MAHVSKHDSEEERERDTGKDSWIDLFVGGNTISVHNFLEHKGERIALEVGWRLDAMVENLSTPCSSELPQCLQNSVLFIGGSPKEPYVDTCILLEHVHGVVESLFLGYVPLKDLQLRNGAH